MAASIDVAIFCVPSLIVKNNYIIGQLLKKMAQRKISGGLKKKYLSLQHGFDT